jgi:hypothetical protein
MSAVHRHCACASAPVCNGSAVLGLISCQCCVHETGTSTSCRMLPETFHTWYAVQLQIRCCHAEPDKLGLPRLQAHTLVSLQRLVRHGGRVPVGCGATMRLQIQHDDIIARGAACACSPLACLYLHAAYTAHHDHKCSVRPNSDLGMCHVIDSVLTCVAHTHRHSVLQCAAERHIVCDLQALVLESRVRQPMAEGVQHRHLQVAVCSACKAA